MPSDKIRIIILNYKRPENVHRIIDVYKGLFPITVINNNPNEFFPYVGQPVDVINNHKNITVWSAGIVATSILNLLSF